MSINIESDRVRSRAREPASERVCMTGRSPATRPSSGVQVPPRTLSSSYKRAGQGHRGVAETLLYDLRVHHGLERARVDMRTQSPTVG